MVIFVKFAGTFLPSQITIQGRCELYSGHFVLSLANIHSTQQDSDDELRRGRGVLLMWNAQKLNRKSNKLSRMVAHHAARHVIGFANLNLIKEMSKRQKLSFRNFKWGLFTVTVQ